MIARFFKIHSGSKERDWNRQNLAHVSHILLEFYDLLICIFSKIIFLLLGLAFKAHLHIDQ
jgi:hypothetical protein